MKIPDQSIDVYRFAPKRNDMTALITQIISWLVWVQMYLPMRTPERTWICRSLSWLVSTCADWDWLIAQLVSLKSVLLSIVMQGAATFENIYSIFVWLVHVKIFWKLISSDYWLEKIIIISESTKVIFFLLFLIYIITYVII